MSSTPESVQAEVEEWADGRLRDPVGGWVEDAMTVILTVLENCEPRLWQNSEALRTKYLSLLQVAHEYFSETMRWRMAEDVFRLGMRVQEDVQRLPPKEQKAFLGQVKAVLDFDF